MRLQEVRQGIYKSCSSNKRSTGPFPGYDFRSGLIVGPGSSLSPSRNCVSHGRWSPTDASLGASPPHQTAHPLPRQACLSCTPPAHGHTGNRAKTLRMLTRSTERVLFRTLQALYGREDDRLNKSESTDITTILRRQFTPPALPWLKHKFRVEKKRSWFLQRTT
jgi:hypothetical protein